MISMNFFPVLDFISNNLTKWLFYAETDYEGHTVFEKDLYVVEQSFPRNKLARTAVIASLHP